MVAQAAQRLAATVRNDASSDADIQAAAQAFFDAVGRASAAEANDALRALASLVSLDNLARAGFIALLCGALVEQGCDSSPLTAPLIRQLQTVLERSALLVDACVASLPKSEEADEDPSGAFEKARKEIARGMPIENEAWEALKQFWRPAIVVFSVNAPARAAAGGLRTLAGKLSDHHEGGHWLRLMLSVLDNEPVVVIEPQTRLGILGRISGVVDNFQLNVLLMDGFPKSGFLARRRVSARVADVARGLGPQKTDDTVTGVWNLYTWQAIETGYKLPDPGDYGASSSWVWNEGSPNDIPLFEGRRAILLGPASYSRSWGSQRMFDKLPAKLEIERQLSKSDVTDWLQRMLTAKGAG